MRSIKFVFVLFLLTRFCESHRIFQSSRGSLNFSNDTLIIICKNTSLLTEVFSPLNQTISAAKVVITLCKLPENPLIETFESMNISSKNIHSLNLNYVDFEAVGDNLTEGLKIQTLELRAKRKQLTVPNVVFKPLTNLKNLTISGVDLPSLPPNLEILEIYPDASITKWDGCESLRELTILKLQSKKQLPEVWPATCNKLLTLKLKEMSEEVSQFLVDSVVVGSPNLQSLSMQFCKLHDLQFEKLPRSIIELDLRNNRISELNREQASQLFATRARRVWFAGNHVVCNCNNNRMLDALHMNQSQMVDYDEVKCSDGRYLLRSVSVSEVCRLVVMSNLEYGLGYVWGLCCSISVFSVLLLVLTRRYGPIVRTILYSRGYCVSCLTDGIDADRPYDAFISFSHGDDQFVLETLLPKLEDQPNDFHVCIHYRDWSVGEWIPAQIMQSVRQSKRTIIVLSKNFVKSWWGVLEFRYAHASAMAEGRSRLLVLILDDVLNDKLQPELQGYLEYHTFLRCNDPFFWDKLRYAMPHKNNTIEDV